MDPENKYYKMMFNELDSFGFVDIRTLGMFLLKNVPDYFFSVPASSSGKYHPAGDLGEGGLVRHSISVMRMLEHILAPEGYYDFTPRQVELLKLAALFHDCMKSGTQEQYEKNQHTKFLHPILAVNFITYIACLTGFDYDETMFITSAIASHMGQWNTSKHEEGKLPVPNEPHQKALHLADYLASRRDINIVIEEEPEIKDETDKEEIVKE